MKILWFDYWVFSKLFSEINSLIAQRRHLLFSMDEISHNYVREECHLKVTKGADSQWKTEWITSNDINFKPCIVKQLLYCRSNVDLGQGRRQDFLWEGKLAFSRPKSEQAKKKNCMQAHSTVVVVSETVLSICPRAVLRRRFFDPLQWLKALKRLNGGWRVWRKGSRTLF